MSLQPTPANLRAEMARFGLKRRDVCEVIGMNVNLLTNYLNELRPLSSWAAHNIGYGINTATGRTLITVDMSRGVVSPPTGRRPYTDIPAAPRARAKRRRQKVY
jgi:hypothetical protein